MPSGGAWERTLPMNHDAGHSPSSADKRKQDAELEKARQHSKVRQTSLWHQQQTFGRLSSFLSTVHHDLGQVEGNIYSLKNAVFPFAYFLQTAGSNLPYQALPFAADRYAECHGALRKLEEMAFSLSGSDFALQHEIVSLNFMMMPNPSDDGDVMPSGAGYAGIPSLGSLTTRMPSLVQPVKMQPLGVHNSLQAGPASPPGTQTSSDIDASQAFHSAQDREHAIGWTLWEAENGRKRLAETERLVRDMESVKAAMARLPLGAYHPVLVHLLDDVRYALSDPQGQLKVSSGFELNKNAVGND